MVYKVDAQLLILEKDRLKISEKNNIGDIEICDVIGCYLSEEPAGFLSGLFGSSTYLVVRYISKGKNYKWTAETIHVTGSEGECAALQNKVNEKLGQVSQRPKRLGVFINPIGGSQNSLDMYNKVVFPLFKIANINCDVNVSERPKHMTDLMNSYDTSSVDGLVILGGDGSLLEILNCLLTKAQTKAGVDYNQPASKLKPLEIPIGIIPTGTGNGAAKFLYGNMDLVTAVLHVIRGETKYNNVQAVYSGGKLASYSMIAVACGFFTDMMYEVDRQRWLKRARYAVVPFYMALFKRKRLFNVKLSVIPGNHSPETLDVEETMEEKKLEPVSSLMSFSGDLLNNARDSTMDYVEMSRNTRKSGFFTLLAFKESGRLEFLSCFMGFLRMTKSLFQMDLLSTYTVRGYKVKFPCCDENLDQDPSMARMNHLLDVDGEMIDMYDGEFEVRTHMKLVKFYTSH